MQDVFPRTPSAHRKALERGCIWGGSGCRGSLQNFALGGGDPLQSRRIASLQMLVQPRNPVARLLLFFAK